MQGRRRFQWSYGYTVLFLCWLGWITIYISRSVLFPLLPVFFKELGLTHTQAGLLGSAYLLGHIIIKLPAGIIANKIGIKKTIILGMVGYALSTALNFIATGYLHILVLRFLLGLFQGVHLPLANTLLSEYFGEKQGRAIGFHESGPNVGNTIAYPLAVIITSNLSWRYAFLILSLPAFILAGIIMVAFREYETPIQEKTQKVKKEINEGIAGYMNILIPLALAHSIYNICLRTLLTFTPLFLVEYKGLNLATAGYIATIMPAAGFFAKISSGFIAERLGRRKAIASAIILSGIFIFASTRIQGNLLLVLNFMILGLSIYSFSPTIYSSVTLSLPTSLKAIGLGIVTMVGNTVGAISTFLVGFLIDSYGYSTTFTAIAGTIIPLTFVIYITMKD
jgi:MFS family permease